LSAHIGPEDKRAAVERKLESRQARVESWLKQVAANWEFKAAMTRAGSAACDAAG